MEAGESNVALPLTRESLPKRNPMVPLSIPLLTCMGDNLPHTPFGSIPTSGGGGRNRTAVPKQLKIESLRA